MSKRNYAEITPELQHYAELCGQNVIDRELYEKFKVNRGLRDLNGKGILTGLTEISEVNGTGPSGEPMEGQLFYRGYRIEDLIRGAVGEQRFGFEETVYLLLIGRLPTVTELAEFKAVLGSYRSLPNSFVRDIIMKAPSNNMMNSMARSVLTYYSYDPKAEQTDLENVLRQCIQLIAMFPQLAVYSYQAYAYYLSDSTSFFFHDADPSLSTAENILRMLRPDMKYTRLEAQVLDIALVLHMDHGGGNNSTFTTHVISSSGTDTYSVVAAALGSLKGPKHGGANIKVVKMFHDIWKNVHDHKDEDEVREYLKKILHKEAFDGAGLIYGFGHAIYSVSDPRALIFKQFVEKLAESKHRKAEYDLYSMIERLAPEIIGEERKIYKGFVYSMLELPLELYTPMFAIARIVGWSAHRMEELINVDKIIRPAYIGIQEETAYTPIDQR